MTIQELSSIPVGQSLLRNKEVVTVISSVDITENVGNYKNDTGKIISLYGRTVVIEFSVHETGKSVVLVCQHPRPDSVILEEYSS